MKNISEKLFVFLLPALFTFPLFRENISSILFIALAVNTAFYNIASKNYKDVNLKILYLTIPFWLTLIFCIIYYDPTYFMKSLRHSLFFLAFPIVFPFIPNIYFTESKLNFYITILKNCCLIISIGFIVGFLIKYDFKDFFVYKYDIPKFRDFVYNEITFFKIHPTYFTSILISCVVFSFEKVLKQKKYFELIYVVAFLLITFLLLSKINILFLGALLFYMLAFRSNLSLRLKLTGVSSLIVLIAVLTFAVPGIKKRFYEMYKSYNSPPKELAYDSTNIRVALMKCNVDVAKENFLWGVGFEAIFDELRACHMANYDAGFYKDHKYLTHNYFIYILITTGIFGFITFLSYCYIVFRNALKINHFLLSVVLINIFIVCLTEDFFYRHFGVFYFSLILMTFIKSNDYKLDEAKKKTFE